MKQFILILFIAIGLFACKQKESIDYIEIDEDLISKYVADSNLNAIATGTGLYYVVQATGVGIQPLSESTVTVAYKGYLTDGTVFDESDSNGITFSLKNVIKGWQEGIPLFKEGGSGILLIPSALGYGSSAQGQIPANSVLIFEINLIDVQ